MKPPNLESFSDNLTTLRAERNKRFARIQPLKNQCAEIRLRLQSGGTPNPGNQEEVRLRALIGKEPIPLVLPDQEQLNSLLVTINHLNAEISTLDAEILKETRVASNKLIDSQKEEIKRRGSAFANAFAELHARHLEYDQLIDDLEDVGASVGQFRIRPNGLSQPKDRSGAYAYGLIEFIDAGYYSKSSLSKVLK
jgi:hypothetical protein